MANTETQILYCAGCGAPLNPEFASNGLCKCKYCGHTNILPKDEQINEVIMLLHEGDNELRNSEFERAYNAYKRASELDSEEARAYFGMALASNRVKYIKDIVNKRYQPICCEVTEKRFDSDKNYSLALDYANTDEQYNEYESRAREIDYIREKFHELAESGLKYDTFICVKVSEEGGGFTQDSVWAGKLYDSIKRAGMKPFYSERDIGDRLGEDYEALILYALYSAKSFILVCGNEDYLRTPWVQNEYSRYHSMLSEKEKAKNSIIIAFIGDVIERIPGIRGKIQGVNLSAFDASQKINDFVAKFATPDEKRTKLCVNCGAEIDDKLRFCPECGNGVFAKNTTELIKMRADIERKAREEAERKAREEAERKAREEAERKAREEAERKAREEAERKAREEAERKAREEAERKAREEAERKAREEAERKAREEAERKAREEAERKAREEAERRRELEVKLQEAEKNASLHSVNDNGGNIHTDTPPKTNSNVKYCKKCGAENSVGAAFCSSCAGKEFSDKNVKYCTSCDTAIPLTAKFCSKCANSSFAGSLEELQKLKGEKKQREEENERKRLEEEKLAAAQAAAERRASIITEEALAVRKRIEKTPFADKNLWRSGCKVQNMKLVSCNTSFKTIEIPNYGESSFTTIGRNAFSSAKVTAVIIPNGVTAIESYAFSGCTTLEYVFIPNSVKTIGEGAFSGCTSLKYVTVPSSVKNIPSKLFSGCSRLQSLAISVGTASIAQDAFLGCTGLELLSIPYNLRAPFAELLKAVNKRVIDKNTVKPQPKAEVKSEEQKAPSQVKITAQEESTAKQETKPVVKEETEEQKAENELKKFIESTKSEVKDYTLVKYGGNETTVTIPKLIKTISKHSFYGCDKVVNIVIHEGVKSIEPSPVLGCPMLANISVDEKNSAYKSVSGVLYTKDGKTLIAYAPAKKDTEFTVPSGVTEIGACAFNRSQYLVNLTVSASVKSIGGNAFAVSKSLKKVTMLCNITEINEGLFCNCESLETVSLPNSITKIGRDAFYNCKKLLNFPTSSNLKTIAGGAFDKCKIRSPIVLPGTVADICLYAFRECEAPSIFIPASVVYMRSGALILFRGNILCETKKPLIGYPKNWASDWCTKGARITWGAKK